jgi:PhnB protein
MSKSDRIIPVIFVNDGPGALDFYKQAFGAHEVSRMMAPDGRKLLHAELEILGHRLFVCETNSVRARVGLVVAPLAGGGTGVRIMLQVDNADQTVARASAAGATVMMPVQDMFWGARYGKLLDPYGHEWGINQQVEELTEAEEQEKARSTFQGLSRA